jgi:predicted component of type VI protein secretion system
MKLSLLVLTAGKMEGKALEIKLSQFLIGRDPQCHLRPASPLISKRHCAILQRDGKVFLRDFGSTNGSFVNDEPVKGEVALTNDDTLKIGPLEFRVRIEAGSAVIKPAAKPVAAAAAAAQKPVPNTALDKAGKRPAVEKTMDEVPALKENHPGGDAADDDIAAMLLAQDDGDAASSIGTDSHKIPDGSTVHEVHIPPEVAGGDADAAKKAEELAKVKAQQANTSAAAKSILEKYLKRPRS